MFEIIMRLFFSIFYVVIVLIYVLYTIIFKFDGEEMRRILRDSVELYKTTWQGCEK